MIAIVDYGMGNLHSVRHALEHVGAEVLVTSRAEDLERAERIVLPGVGAFGECMRNLHATGLVETLEEQVRAEGKPFLGICLGMQALAEEGLELGHHKGLGWLRGVVEPLPVAGTGLKLPHVGWNEVRPSSTGAPLFRGLRKDASFYFVHSYRLRPSDPAVTAATCDYGGAFTAAVLDRNVFATQFHPEKSQQDGLRLLANFLDWRP